MKSILSALFLAAFWWPFVIEADGQFDQCLLRQMATADDTLTIGELRQFCQSEQAQQDMAETATDDMGVEVTENGVETESAISRRLFLEKKEARNPFVLLPHKPNYIILSNNMSSPNERPFELADPAEDVQFQPWETKFQISLKLPVARGLFNNRADMFVAYTNRSFWQQFNKDGSAPFRDSNHEPEAWLSFQNDFELFGVKNSIIRTGFSHQSNGQSGTLSRSWNRVYADFVFEYDDLYFSFKPWWRVPEDSDNDDNPDIEDYMGNFELGALYKVGNNTFDVMLRNNLDFGDNRGAVQLGWSFPLTERVRGYVQWFNGYGESLIDYDAHSNSIGFGIQLSDWL
ncbi:phospholipase A [Methylophaga sp. OBS4]|uniref:phospholipase A n=1 Tax=Methylophaga sp. OBS4 TaxID=2991935 RepID=UPI00224DEF4A|nr:phospholipase A [Methylophaga sp. OBS4]MCX4186999.1 phospholipase A [Methylophaga sp. OBS4]